MPSEKKVIKVERTYEDGTQEYLEGRNLENYLENLDVASSIAGTRSYIQFKPVEWIERSFDADQPLINEGE